MSTSRREWMAALAAGAAAAQGPSLSVTRYVRFRKGNRMSYGVLEGDTVREIRGDLLGERRTTSTQHRLAEVKLLYPIVPPKVLAVGLNYRSHLGNRTPPSQPEIFYKPTSCLQNPDDAIVIPKDAKNVHYEGEMVLVIGKALSRATPQQAREGILGITCGNDVSERDWQGGPNKDLQWWRAKGADTFGPLGPSIVVGLDPGRLLLQTRLNGEVVQKQNTSDLLFGPVEIVAFISRYVALAPGDIIYTGTPGATRPMKAGDIVEVDIEGIGVLKNKVAEARA